MQTLKISLNEYYFKEARRLGIIDNASDFFNKALIDFVESKKAEMEKQQVLAGLKEAADDVKNNRVSRIDNLWDSIDD